MSAETCAYLNTDLTSLVEYLTNKYNLARENTSEIIAEDDCDDEPYYYVSPAQDKAKSNH